MKIAFVAYVANAFDRREKRRGFIGGRIVDDDDLQPNRSFGRQGLQTLQRQIRTVKNRDDDAHDGVFRSGEMPGPSGRQELFEIPARRLVGEVAQILK